MGRPVKGELEKLAYLPCLGAHTLDLSVLPAQRRRFLAGVGARSADHVRSRRHRQRLPLSNASEGPQRSVENERRRIVTGAIRLPGKGEA